jgi:uncharacterized protein
MHMNELFEYSDNQINQVSADFVRYLYLSVHWKSRLIGIKGGRGTGKTTLLLQYLKKLGRQAPQAVYLSLDDLYFTTNTVTDTVASIYKRGGKIVVLDEVHKYAGWAREVKNLYDRYTDLQIIFTGSSIIDIAKEEADLSRRAVLYELHGLSYREYLHLAHNIRFEPIPLQAILDRGRELRSAFPKEFRPLQHFKAYLEHGYYPYFAEDPETYTKRLQQVVRMTVEVDMAELKGFDVRNAGKLLQLLGIAAQSVPFKPNISKLADKTGIHRNSLVNYLHYLQRARLVHLLYPTGKSTSTLQKPEKLFLNNPNLATVLCSRQPNAGNLRETFMISQLRVQHSVYHPKSGDFLVDEEYTLEVGGPSKSGKQIAGVKSAYTVVDELEYPVAGQIPLWLFGFLY